MIHAAAVSKAVTGAALAIADLGVLAQITAGDAQPILGPWGQAGVFVAGIGAGAAAVVWTLRSLRELRSPGQQNGGSEVAAERRTAAAVRQITEEIADTRHELRTQLHDFAKELNRLEKETAQEFRALERSLRGGQ